MRTYKKIKGNYYEKAQFDSHKSQMFFYQSREEYLMEMLNLKQTNNVLEIGCGSGVLSKKIQEKFKCKMTACDISQAAIKHAKKFENKKLKFKVADINKLPFKKNSFDAVIISHLIEHVENPVKALMKTKAVMKKGGKLLIATPNYFSLWPLAEIVFDKTLAKKNYSLKEQHISKFNTWSLEKILKDSGFKIEKIKTLYFASIPLALFSKRIARIIFNFEKLFANIPTNMIIYALAVKK